MSGVCGRIIQRWKQRRCRYGDLVNEVYTISSEEMETVIKELPEGKACGSDDTAAELLQSMGEKGMEIMSRLINKIYKSGQIPEDFRKSIFESVPKAQQGKGV